MGGSRRIIPTPASGFLFSCAPAVKPASAREIEPAPASSETAPSASPSRRTAKFGESFPPTPVETAGAAGGFIFRVSFGCVCATSGVLSFFPDSLPTGTSFDCLPSTSIACDGTASVTTSGFFFMPNVTFSAGNPLERVALVAACSFFPACSFFTRRCSFSFLTCASRSPALLSKSSCATTAAISKHRRPSRHRSRTHASHSHARRWHLSAAHRSTKSSSCRDIRSCDRSAHVAGSPYSA
mmetsp:Transcript_13597/g.44965  ORF Transcript_13597/g.44965 Transcript_13597/m.44965 type:complete len:240 (-) Transcript_13597:658-1377(-)